MRMKTEQDLRDAFGHNIRTRRKSRGWSQEKLAEKAGVSKNTISDIEACHKFAHAETLINLAIALETEVYELVKPRDILPDTSKEMIIKYGEEMRAFLDNIEGRYLKNEKK